MRRLVFLVVLGFVLGVLGLGCNAILGGNDHVLDACTPGATKCDATGANVLTCADGQAFTQQMACPFACVSGACSGMCVPAATQCSGSTPQTCDATGTWQSGSCTAAQVCKGGSCVSGCFIGGSEYAPGTANPSNPCQSCQPATSTSAWSNIADGMACGAGEVCNAGACTAGCSIGGAVYQSGAANPNNPCQSCQPATSTTAWTSVTDGMSCGNGQVCASGMCGTQCDVGGSIYPTGMDNPSNACQSCQPGTSTTAWTNLSDGTGCGSGEVCNAGSCAAGCFIGGTVYAANAADPTNPCMSCQPATSTTAWSNVSDGTGCGSGEVCSGGACGAGCFIAGTVYAANAANPGNACQSCQPGSSTTAWSNVTDGTTCGSGGICHTGACVSGCEVSGVYYAVNAPDPNNACESCQPGTSTKAFSDVANGSACGNGQFCGNGQCGTECDIGGTGYASGTLDPTNACQSCQPGVSTTAWSNLATGTTCATGEVCNAGSCVAECFIGGALHASGVANPADDCQSCQPATTTMAWSNVPNGTSCASQEVCSTGSCISGCFIAGSVYTSGTPNPSFICQSCQPATSTTSWTTDSDGTVCGSGEVCKGGVCVHQVILGSTGASQNFVVPAGVTQITVSATGAAGNDDCYGTLGGNGASVVATIPVTPGETLVVNVGGMGGHPSCAAGGLGGFNGGGTAGPSTGGYAGGGGGGASDVRRGGAALANRAIVAAGGGGGGAGPGAGAGGNGGNASGIVGGNGNSGSTGGGPGTQTGGGAAGLGGNGCAGGVAGVLGVAGSGGGGGTNPDCGGGGGGGGYYGGGGGGCAVNAAGGGGGGSSFVEASAAGVTITPGVATGSGQVVINY